MSHYQSDPSQVSRSARSFLPGFLVIALLISGGGFFLKSTLAANIAISSGNLIEFGQSVSRAVACSSGQNLTVTPKSSFVNAAGSGGTHYFSSVTVSNIPVNCYGKDFTIRAYGSTSDTPLALFNATSTSAVVFNDNGTFRHGVGSTGETITSSSKTFTFTFASPVAVSSTVIKLTIESGEHTEFLGVGEKGPGGGKIFYYSASGFTCGPSLTGTCNYLEAAPSGWNTGSDPSVSWATDADPGVGRGNQSISISGAYGTAIGTGYKNSIAIVNQSGNIAASTAAVSARGYRGVNSLNDWYLPSQAELAQIYTNRTIIGGIIDGSFYWSSTERWPEMAWAQIMSNGFGNEYQKYFDFSVRPIRAF